ncbi:MAG: zinc-ribbon domain-containing protein [Deltaproteobacteria bacterium]|nr:zinc-ribbon domain-containing protein [Deltaproteobacteria bacterium]
MIITCNECDTRFNLDESLLKQTGSKVRCSKCKNIFTAYPSSLSEESDKSSEVETELEIAITDKEIESNEQYKVEEAATESQEEIDFSDIDNFLEMDVDLKAEKEPEELDLEIDKTPVETEAELEPDMELELDLENEIDETPVETETEADFELDMEPDIDENKQKDIDQDETIEKYTAEKIAEEKETSKVFNMGTLSDEQEDEKAVKSVDKVEKSTLIEESKPQYTAEKKRISKPVLLLLFATLLIGGAYGTYVLINSLGINIPFVSNLLKPEVQEAGNLKIYISDINNKFVENSKIGKLLVITGKAKNGYSDARSYISIISKLYTKGKILSKTKTVYCGIVLSELDLITMELDSITNRFSNRFGDNKSNVKVKAGAIIPFMVVFADLPENLDEFTIEVTKSLPL